MQFLHILRCVIFNILYKQIGVATYFVYYRYINHNKENVSKYYYAYQEKVINHIK